MVGTGTYICSIMGRNGLPHMQHRAKDFILQYICVILNPAFETETLIKPSPYLLLFLTRVAHTYLAFQRKKKLFKEALFNLIC